MILIISDRLGTAKALEVLNSIEEKVYLLQNTPYIGTQLKYMGWKQQGYRVLTIEWIIFRS